MAAGRGAEAHEWAEQSWGASSLATSLGEVSLASTDDDLTLSATLGPAAVASAARRKAARARAPVRPAYLTMASINRYAGDCAARAARADRGTQPAPAHLVWKWYDMAEIPAMIQQTAHEVLADLQVVRSQQRGEVPTRGAVRPGRAGGALPAVREAAPHEARTERDPVTSVIRAANLVMQDVALERATRQRKGRAPSRAATARQAHGAMAVVQEGTDAARALRNSTAGGVLAAALRPAASRSASRSSQPPSSDPREDLLIGACGSLLAADFESLRNSSISQETTRRSTWIPKPHTVHMTNIASSRQLPDGLKTPVTGRYSLDGARPGSRRDAADVVEWSSQTNDEAGVITLHVKTPDIEAKTPTAKTPDQRPASTGLCSTLINDPRTPERITRLAPRTSLELGARRASTPAANGGQNQSPARPEDRLQALQEKMDAVEPKQATFAAKAGEHEMQQFPMRKKTTGPSNLHAYTSSLLASRKLMSTDVHACVKCELVMLHMRGWVGEQLLVSLRQHVYATRCLTWSVCPAFKT